MKKGVSSTVIFMIVVVVGAIILFSGYKLWAGEAEGAFDKETCRASVIMTSLSKIGTGSPWINLKCSTRKRELNIENRENLIRVLVNDVKEAWYQYGSGKIDFTSNWDFIKSHTYCFVSSAFVFDKEGKTIVLEEIYPYISKLSYIENVKIGNTEVDRTLKISPNDPIFITFVVGKEPSKSVWGLIKGLVYKSGHFPVLLISNEESIDAVCSSVYINSKQVEKKDIKWLVKEL